MTLRASGNREADANSCAGVNSRWSVDRKCKESLKSLDRSPPVSKNWFPGVMTSVRQGLLGPSYFHHCRLIEESQGAGIMLPFQGRKATIVRIVPINRPDVIGRYEYLMSVLSKAVR